MLTGSMRVAQEARSRAAALEREQEMERVQRRFEHRRSALEAQIAALQAELVSEQLDLERQVQAEAARTGAAQETEREIAARRRVRPEA